MLHKSVIHNGNCISGILRIQQKYVIFLIKTNHRYVFPLFNLICYMFNPIFNYFFAFVNEFLIKEKTYF